MKQKTFLRRVAAYVMMAGVLALAFGPSYQDIVLAEGAVLGLTPQSVVASSQRTFTLKVVLDSGGGAGVNAADGTISFDPNFLSVSSLQKENNVFNLWTSDPSFSNSKGTVTFSSGSPTPYTKSGGALLAVTFKALKEGVTEVSFSAGSALAADGQGTNVLTGMGKASVTIGPNTGPADPEPVPAVAAPVGSGDGSAAPVAVDISSPTHPDPDKWYANKNPEFRWKLPPDVSGASAAIGEGANITPPRVSEGLIDSKRFDNVADGVWYFAVRFNSSAGGWSQAARRKAQIDVTPPEGFSFEVRNDNKDIPPVLVLRASDKTSGLDRYEVKLDDREGVAVAPGELREGEYTMAPVLPGDHKVTVKAIDRAGNAAEASRQFSIPGRAAPEINVSGSVDETQYLIVEGAADHDAQVFIRIEFDSKVVSENSAKADEDGKWLYVHNKSLRRGEHEVSVKMITKAGAESGYTPKTKIDVSAAPFMVRFGWLIIALLLIAALALGGYIFYERREFARRLSLTRRETDEVKFKTAAIFAALNEEIEEKLQLLDEAAAAQLGVPKMTPNDLLDKFRDALDISQDTLEKEIEDVEKTLEDN
jgi:hypothetical protein